MDMTRVVLHIDRLVLRGIDRGDAASLSAALRTAVGEALQHRLTDPDALAPLSNHLPADALRAGLVTASREFRGAALGRAVAHSLFQGDPP
jgi:hypothetical protein